MPPWINHKHRGIVWLSHTEATAVPSRSSPFINGWYVNQVATSNRSGWIRQSWFAWNCFHSESVHPSVSFCALVSRTSERQRMNPTTSPSHTPRIPPRSAELYVQNYLGNEKGQLPIVQIQWGTILLLNRFHFGLHQCLTSLCWVEKNLECCFMKTWKTGRMVQTFYPRCYSRHAVRLQNIPYIPIQSFPTLYV